MSFHAEIKELASTLKPVAPVQVKKPIEAPAIIGEEMKKQFSKVAMDEHKLPIDPKEKMAIKLMVMMAYPDVDIDQVRDLELQTKYYPQYLDGTLQKKCEQQQIKLKDALKIIKAEKKDPSKAAEELLDIRLAAKYEGYAKFPRAKKEELRKEEQLKFLKLIVPENFAVNNDKNNRRQLRELTLTNEAFIFAFQTGKIQSKEDFEKILKDPHQIGDLQFEYSETYFKEHPELLEKFNSDKIKGRHSARRIYMAYERGKLDRAIAAENNMTLEELHHSGKYTELKFAYLKAHESELNNFEKRALKTLREQAEKNNGDLTGVNNVAAGSNVDTSVTEQVLAADGIDIENEEITITNKEDLEKLAGYKAQIEERLQECETREELKACIQDVRSHANTDYEAKILDMMMNHIIAEAAEKDNNTQLTPELYLEALEEIGVSPHMAVMTSTTGNAETQVAYSEIVAKSEKLTNTQKAGYTSQVIPEYEKKAQDISTNNMTDTGIQEVIDVLPETYAKLDEDAAKASYEYAMNSGKLTDEQKATIARDTIDSTTNEDLKKFYQDLADKYKVDYTSVPPKSERPQAAKPAENNSSNKVEGTNFTQKEVAEILNRQQDQNMLELIGNGIKETVDIILGKTPDNNITGNAPTITSLNTAISELKTGGKLTDVFRKSNATTKKELVEIICSYGKTAIAQLIDAFGGQTIYKLAKTNGAKALIKTEIERIALSDSTQRVELAEIKKAEEKDSMSARA